MKQNPAKIVRNKTIAEHRLQGATYRELSKQFNLSKSALHHILTKDELVKDVIETGTRELVACVPKAIDNYRLFLVSDNEKIKYEASKDILKTNRIMASHTAENIFIQNIFNQTNIGALTPAAVDYMAYLQDRQSEAINVLPEE